MKTVLLPKRLRLFSVVGIWFASALAAHAVIGIAGPTTYTQNFDSLIPATQPWLDDQTLPGWLAGINENNTADGNLQISDGTDGALTALLNLGVSGALERALGSKTTGTGGAANIAYGVLFQNTSGIPLMVTDVTYTGELWRTNTADGIAEMWTTYYKISPTLFTDTEPGPNSATPNQGTFTAAPQSLNWASPNNTPVNAALNGNLPENRSTQTGTLSALLQPNEYFMFRWIDTNLAGTDGHQGIDDFSIVFVVPEPSSALFALVGGFALLRRRQRLR